MPTLPLEQPTRELILIIIQLNHIWKIGIYSERSYFDGLIKSIKRAGMIDSSE